MKTLKILLLAAILLGSYTLKTSAQTVVASNNLDAFIGTWEYRTSTEYFKITLQEGFYSSDISFPCLVGGYYYQKNGVTVADYLSFMPSIVNGTNRKQVKIIVGSLAPIGQPTNATLATLLFIDDGKEQKGSGMGSSFTLLTPATARWKLVEGERITLTDDYGNYYPGFEPEPLGFSVPTNVVLTKVPTPVYISAWGQYDGQNCVVYVSASAPVASTMTIALRGSGGLGRFSMTIPKGSTSAQQTFYVPGDTDIEIEDISPNCDSSHCYF